MARDGKAQRALGTKTPPLRGDAELRRRLWRALGVTAVAAVGVGSGPCDCDDPRVVCADLSAIDAWRQVEAGGALGRCPDLEEFVRFALDHRLPRPAGTATSDSSDKCCYGYEGDCTGRPFLVRGRARVARLIGERPSERRRLSPRRRRIGEGWARIALMEHASVVAFARFSWQLEVLGAPRDLIARSHQAMTDEALHAGLAFGLASESGGSSLRAGALDLTDAFRDCSLESVTLTTVHEGCIGETIAALAAAEALGSASDAPAIAVLSRIARDEAAHAELAWRFVRWAIEMGGHSLKRTIMLQLEAARRAAGPVRRPSLDAPERELLAGGIVPERLHRFIRATAMNGIVREASAILIGLPAGVHTGASRESAPSRPPPRARGDAFSRSS